MRLPGEIPLDEVINVDFITSASTGAATDADSTPTVAVYEESTDTDIGIGGNATKRTSLTGNYRFSFTASAANGFEVGKFYAVVASATVGGVAGKTCATFRCIAAEAVAGFKEANAAKVGGTNQTGRDLGASVLVGDKTGFSLADGSIVTATFGTCDFTSTQKASITAAVPTVLQIQSGLSTFDSSTDTVTPADVDGLSWADTMEVLLARIAGVANPLADGKTIIYRKRDGVTAKITITLGDLPGERTGSVIDG